MIRFLYLALSFKINSVFKFPILEIKHSSYNLLRKSLSIIFSHLFPRPCYFLVFIISKKFFISIPFFLSYNMPSSGCIAPPCSFLSILFLTLSLLSLLVPLNLYFPTFSGMSYYISYLSSTSVLPYVDSCIYLLYRYSIVQT